MLFVSMIIAHLDYIYDLKSEVNTRQNMSSN